MCYDNSVMAPEQISERRDSPAPLHIALDYIPAGFAFSGKNSRSRDTGHLACQHGDEYALFHRDYLHSQTYCSCGDFGGKKSDPRPMTDEAVEEQTGRDSPCCIVLM